MPFCEVCGFPVAPGVEICSVKCRRKLAIIVKRRRYAREKGKRLDDAMHNKCVKCGARLQQGAGICVKCERAIIASVPITWNCHICGKRMQHRGRVCHECRKGVSNQKATD